MIIALLNKTLIILIVFTSLLFTNKESYCCTCVKISEINSVNTEKYDFIFIGNIIRKEIININGHKRKKSMDLDVFERSVYKYTVELKTIYKLIKIKNFYIEIYSNVESATCGIDLKLGANYIIFANYGYDIFSTEIFKEEEISEEKRIGYIYTDRCTPTIEYNELMEENLDKLIGIKTIYKKETIKIK